MMADCRRSNEVFIELLGARLATGDALGALEMTGDDDALLTVEGASLKGAFYRLELPEQLRSYCECMDYYSNRFAKCRKEQEAFEACAPL